MIKSARTPGLAHVYEDILGFEGAEFYLHCWDAKTNSDGSPNQQYCPEVVGARFGDLFKVFQNAIPFGIRRPDAPGDNHDELHRVAGHLIQNNENGPQHSVDIVAAKYPAHEIFLNPPHKLILKKGDEILVLSEDDDTYYINVEELRRLKGEPYLELEQQKDLNSSMVHPELILMCGWRRDVDDIIVLLNELAPPGSELHMVNEIPMNINEEPQDGDIDERLQKLADGGLDLRDLQTAEQDEMNPTHYWLMDSHPDDVGERLRNMKIVQQL